MTNKYDIGTIVTITNPGAIYTTYTKMFKEMGFNNPDKSHDLPASYKTDTWIILNFRMHETLKYGYVYKLENQDGVEVAMSPDGFKVANPEATITKGRIPKHKSEDFFAVSPKNFEEAEDIEYIARTNGYAHAYRFSPFTAEKFKDTKQLGFSCGGSGFTGHPELEKAYALTNSSNWLPLESPQHFRDLGDVLRGDAYVRLIKGQYVVSREFEPGPAAMKIPRTVISKIPIIVKTKPKLLNINTND